ncbi:1-(5-phosphoribosyl)-5-amino-4-imidazole-carboxylate (AIR) carboxylase [Alkalidesulfovibrio alkalitolerans DSM 16529]|jgi:NCAIR mutase (PurE)-related protein|uniref:1-(5-phosphoribosyl)-5-amino-4-imidazole-carboxylate (AIR) carboxylase n=1 Tax=Alkalidesulfovibrio alkalitolerans DSM 16529 TaxID=1121439 RepID=S7UFK1_9BACT|nr:nickel pincer cofactor biosynthesis protein LarB [Alkalidesulfovibrio alkalitolerans]EPR31003.1 1-(5-phosphoribosyl)-5-amino-4-imidazole-carboxylate (AIR) carboxylase [Alkalidesulfovibrio alkalitolerans DSM 16529]
MDDTRLRAILDDVSSGRMDAQTAHDALKGCRFAPYARLAEGICLDTSRAARTGQPEVVFGQGKDDRQLVAAVGGLRDAGQPALVTRLDPAQGEKLLTTFPEGEYWERPRLFSLGRSLELAEPWPASGEVMIVSAGAADLPVAMEALGAARFFGLSAGFLADVGVAGLHRLLQGVEALSVARLHVAVAGMEGALPSVLAGMFGKPVIAVPTSVGYGTGLSGLAALLTMLNSCAPGLCVVNIDNGYGAAALAAKLLAALSTPAPDERA